MPAPESLMKQPLAGIRVLDFSTLLPGPMATLLLAEVGVTQQVMGGEEYRIAQFKLDAVMVAFTGKEALQPLRADVEKQARRNFAR